MKQKITFDQLADKFGSAVQNFPDKRTGNNTRYTMKDIGLGAFSVFFTQSPSFLSHQKSMREAKGESNAETFFGIDKIPTDNHIRNHLDAVEPELVYPVFDEVYNGLKAMNIIDSFRSYRNNILVALDGTCYHSSNTIHCDKCLRKEHKDGSVTYYHSAITPVIVAPGKNKVIPLPPEFITQQDGHTKQDCENAAAKRWINNSGQKYKTEGVTILGDDLYCKHPLCAPLLENDFDFIFTCKPTSHKKLYEWLEKPENIVFITTKKYKNGKHWEIHTYRYANDVPIRNTDDALRVDWCEVTINDEKGDRIYKNSFATNFNITATNVADIVADGRARFKVENENNNVLKTKGYNLEHNFGHGKENLSMLLMTFNLLAFLFHTVLEFCDEKYRLLRQKLPTRKTFFDDIRALTRYVFFRNWDGMLDFMLKGLESKHAPSGI